jgi:ribonuclease-3
VPQLASLQARLGYTFRDAALLRAALTHPSVAIDRAFQGTHNQRLEFLGDAVLQLALTRELYERFPTFEEGPLTKARAKLVNRRTLAVHARRLELGPLLILSRGEETHGGRDRASSLADCFEAVIGAIFLDGGYEAARDFVLRDYQSEFGELVDIPLLDNPKGELQEFLQAKSTRAPKYQVASSSGPEHDRSFECVVTHDGVELARGAGKSKKEAEGEAARLALQVLRAAAPAES